MGAVYATVEDISVYGRALTAAEQTKAEPLLAAASAKLRIAARQYRKDIDAMIAADPDMELAIKDIVVRAVVRALDSVSSSEVPSSASQSTQSALGYSQTISYVNAGQSLYLLRIELKDIGIIWQRYGAMEVYNIGDKRDTDRAYSQDEDR